MAKTTTTLSAAVTNTDEVIIVASANGFAANNLIRLDQEWMAVLSTYVSGTTIPVRRGLNGSFNDAHAVTANVITGLTTDFDGPSATVVTAYPLSGLRRKLTSYGAAGAITLPVSGEDVIAVINGTQALGMTVAAPSKDIDGSILVIIGNGKAAHTVSLPAGIGLGAGGSGVDVGTFGSGAQMSVVLIAANGAWVPFPSFYGGTSLSTITVTWA